MKNHDTYFTHRSCYVETETVINPTGCEVEHVTLSCRQGDTAHDKHILDTGIQRGMSL